MRDKSNTHSQRTNTLIVAAIVVGALYVGREVVLPFALAVLIAFLIAPAVKRLERWRIPRLPATLFVVSVAFMGCGLLAYFVAQQAYDFAYSLPSYEDNILEKARWLQGSNDGAWSRATQAIADVRQKMLPNDSLPVQGKSEGGVVNDEITATAELQSGAVSDSPDGKRVSGVNVPIQVEVVKRLSSGDFVKSLIGPLIAPLATMLTVVIFVIFMLLEREDLRNRVIRVVGASQLTVTTKALDDAAKRVSRYLLLQLIVNGIFGLLIALGLFLIGIPNAILWGTIGVALRFIPMIGPWIAAVVPLALSLALFSGWAQPVLTFGLFFVVEMVSSNVLETWLYGTSTGVSTIGILGASIFWSWMWGPIGLVLATPLTVCLTVVGRYVPQLEFLNALIGDEEALPPAARYYQRLLSDDIDEAISVADDFLKGHSLSALFDEVLLPALRLAEGDRHQGILDEQKLDFLRQTTRDYVEELNPVHAPGAQPVSVQATAGSRSARILCLPAHDKSDEIAAVMLAQLLAAEHIRARVLSIDSLSGEMISEVDSEGLQAVCISGLPPFASTRARFLCKRLRAKFAHLDIMVGLWQPHGISEKSRQGFVAAGVTNSCTSMEEAVASYKQLFGERQISQAA